MNINDEILIATQGFLPCSLSDDCCITRNKTKGQFVVVSQERFEREFRFGDEGVFGEDYTDIKSVIARKEELFRNAPASCTHLQPPLIEDDMRTITYWKKENNSRYRLNGVKWEHWSGRNVRNLIAREG